eukprot:TRINITY_DN9049_c0_g1_i1.p1 TRINITY_DN9049_c0_g1~~TRINITY_DN9049_c0_g1_i1.p1  ORF type:complete len:150 (-),score=39.36 TRINITY_DN9049_c0_g1_i1:181-630(-)
MKIGDYETTAEEEEILKRAISMHGFRGLFGFTFGGFLASYGINRLMKRPSSESLNHKSFFLSSKLGRGSVIAASALLFGSFGTLWGVNKLIGRIAALDSPLGFQCRDLYQNLLYVKTEDGKIVRMRSKKPENAHENMKENSDDANAKKN